MDWNVLRLSLSIIASLLHTFGFIVLWNVKQTNPYLVMQRFYLLNLSVAENVHAIFLAHYYGFKLVGNERWMNFMMICSGGGSFIWFLLILIVLTVDRFFTVYLNLRYLKHKTNRRTKIVLLICFLISLILNVIFLITLPNLDRTLTVFAMYIWFPLEVFFIFFLVIIYAYIIWRVSYTRTTVLPKNKESPVENHTEDFPSTPNSNRVKPEVTVNSNVSQANLPNRESPLSITELPSTICYNQDIPLSPAKPKTSKQVQKVAKKHMKQYKRSRTDMSKHKKAILVPAWLVTTFVVFIAIPDVGYFITVTLMKMPRPFALKVAAAFYPVGIICDAIIYIFFVKEVRTYLLKKIKCC
eukprot:TCONS_00002368-protein